MTTQRGSCTFQSLFGRPVGDEINIRQQSIKIFQVTYLNGQGQLMYSSLHGLHLDAVHLSECLLVVRLAGPPCAMVSPNILRTPRETGRDPAHEVHHVENASCVIATFVSSSGNVQLIYQQQDWHTPERRFIRVRNSNKTFFF